MRNFDVIIVGAGPLAIKTAQLISKQTSSIAIIKQPHQWDAQYHQYLTSLAGTTADLPLDSLKDTVSLIEGACRFVGPSSVEVNSELFSAPKILLAAGFEPQIPSNQKEKNPPVFPWELFASDRERPSSITIIGGGPFGVATAFHLIQHSITPTIITRGTRLLSEQEPQISQSIHDRLTELGTKIIYGTTIRNVDIAGPWIPALGVRPMTKSLNLSAANVFVGSDGSVLTTDDLMTSAQRHVWAGGAIRSGHYRLNEENEDAEIAANNLFETLFNVQRKTSDPLPFVIPTTPPIASIGLTESLAIDRKLSVKTSVTVWESPERGLIKLVAKKRSGHLLGAHIIGAHAGEMISFFNLAMRGEIPLTDLTEHFHHAELSCAPRIAQSIRQWVTAP